MFNKETYISRRAALLFLGLSLFCSCKKYPSLFSFNNVSSDNSVTLDDINVYLHGVKNIPPTKSSQVEIEPVCDRSDTLLYIVNYEKGWEVLTADKRAPRVVSYSASGRFSREDLASNPAVAAVYDGVMEQIRFLKKNPDLKLDKEYEDWSDLRQITEHESWVLIGTETTEIEQLQDHLTVTRWGQDYPWNIRAPYTDSSHAYNCLAGCGPVAAAQLLYFFHSTWNIPEKAYGDCVNNMHILPGKDSLVLHVGDVNFPSVTYYEGIWNMMPLEYTETSSYFCSVATLMTQMGVLLGAKYYADHTSTHFRNTQNCLLNIFGIESSYSATYDSDIVFENVYAGFPCLLSVYKYEIDDDGSVVRKGHDTIVDACSRRIQRITRRYVWNSLIYGPQYKTTVTDNVISTSFGFNWGWSGTGMMSGGSTKWFNADIISWSAGGHTYTNVDGMLYNFEAGI